MRRNLGNGVWLAVLLALPVLATSRPASGQAEPLTLRVSDAEGEPGGSVAVILRTYASRPVSQGRLGLHANPSSGFAAPLGSTMPFASFDGGTIFGVNGDVVGTIDWNPFTQSVDATFSSASASINAVDGLLAVLRFTLDAGVAPGSVYDLALDFGGVFFLEDANGDPLPWTPRAGALKVLAPSSPATLEVGGPKVHPGAYAEVEIETLEPFAVASGVVELTYPSGLLLEPVSVLTDPYDRHGSVTVTSALVTEPGRLRIEFFSPGVDFNETPGALFVVGFRTSASTPIGTIGQLGLDGVETVLEGPGASPIALALAGDIVEFVNDPGIFHDDFEWGTLGAWSVPGN